jgi:hypothetical protein
MQTMQTMSTMQRHDYAQEEAEAILRRALRQSEQQNHPQPGAFSHEQLRQMAAEMGIEAAVLDQAAHEWTAEEQMVRERRQFIAGRRREFLAHLAPYLLVNALLVSINLLTGARYFWAIWPILGWGMGIASHAVDALRTSGDCFEKEFQQWRQSQSDESARAARPDVSAAKSATRAESAA